MRHTIIGDSTMINWVKERHEFWWNLLLERVYIHKNFDKRLPKIKWTTKVSSTAGQANRLMCNYNLNYVMQEQGKYDETICHEICHTFADRLIVRSGHRDLWRYLYNIVCGAERGRYHHYKIVTKETQPEEVKLIAELLKVQKKLSACQSK